MTIYDAFKPFEHIPAVQEMIARFQSCDDSCAELPVSIALAIIAKESCGGDDRIREVAEKIISYQERVQDPCHLWTILKGVLMGCEDEIAI